MILAAPRRAASTIFIKYEKSIDLTSLFCDAWW